jgi:hypothetical protein
MRGSWLAATGQEKTYPDFPGPSQMEHNSPSRHAICNTEKAFYVCRFQKTSDRSAPAILKHPIFLTKQQATCQHIKRRDLLNIPVYTDGAYFCLPVTQDPVTL